MSLSSFLFAVPNIIHDSYKIKYEKNLFSIHVEWGSQSQFNCWLIECIWYTNSIHQIMHECEGELLMNSKLFNLNPLIYVSRWIDKEN